MYSTLYAAALVVAPYTTCKITIYIASTAIKISALFGRFIYDKITYTEDKKVSNAVESTDALSDAHMLQA